MGNNQADSHNYGIICISIKNKSLVSGELCQGIISVLLKQSYNCNMLSLKFEGIEFTSWRGKHYNHQKDIEKFQAKPFFSCESQIIKWTDQHILHPGQYSFPFSFLVPATLPGSFFHLRDRIKAKTYYTLSAILKCPTDTPNIQSIIEVPVREPISLAIPEPKLFLQKIKGCCDMDLGQLNIVASLGRTAYAPGEEIQLELEIDHTKGKADIEYMKVELRHILQLRAEDLKKNFEEVLVEKNLLGVPIGKKKSGDNRVIVALQLPPQVGEETNASVKGEQKGKMSPSSKGHNIVSEYGIDIKFFQSGCCVGDAPMISLPFQVYSITVYKEMIQEPGDWNPRVMQTSNLVMQENSRIYNNYKINSKMEASTQSPSKMINSHLISFHSNSKNQSFYQLSQQIYNSSPKKKRQDML